MGLERDKGLGPHPPFSGRSQAGHHDDGSLDEEGATPARSCDAETGQHRQHQPDEHGEAAGTRRARRGAT